MLTLNTEQVLDIYQRRRATRYYQRDKKISAVDFETILQCGRWSPSSVGSEPWQFIVVQNPQLREQLKAVAWGMATQVDDASHLVVIAAKKKMRYDSEFLRESMARRGVTGDAIAPTIAKYQDFQQNDAHLLESERALFDWASKQTYIALANMMTAATMLGIDSCPIEGFQYDAVNRILAEAGVLDAEEWGVSVMVTFGYRAKDIRPKGRRELNDMVQWVD